MGGAGHMTQMIKYKHPHFDVHHESIMSVEVYLHRDYIRVLIFINVVFHNEPINDLMM